jgi:flagellar biosynthesis/type III secretory pathway protein FliH
MIKFEHDSLVLDSSHTKEDQTAINDFIAHRAEQAYSKGWEAGYDAALMEIQEEPTE